MAIYDENGNYMGEGDEGDFDISNGNDGDEGDFDLSDGMGFDGMALAALVGMGGLGGMFGGEELLSPADDDDVEPESWVHEDDGKPAPEGVPAVSGAPEAAAMDFS